MELINCSIVTVILCQLNIISKNSISETIISSDRVYNCFDNTPHELSVLLQSIVHFLGFSCFISIFSILHPLFENFHRNLRSGNCRLSTPSRGSRERMRRRSILNSFLGSLKFSNHQFSHTFVSKLTNSAGVSLLFDHFILVIQSLLFNVLLVTVLHPLDAVHISKECLPGLVIVAGKGRCGGIAGSCSIYIQILGQKAFKH